jgi:hypothetical protein
MMKAGERMCTHVFKASLTSMHNLFWKEHNRIAEALFQELSLTTKKTGLELDELVYQGCAHCTQNVLSFSFLSTVQQKNNSIPPTLVC